MATIITKRKKRTIHLPQPEPILFTQAGYDQIVAEKNDLIQKRPLAVEELSRARDEGDRSENAAYKAARWNLSGLDKRLRQLNRIIDNSHISTPQNNEYIQIGHYVTLNTINKNRTFQIVGSFQADPKLNRISHESPLGSILMNKTVGERIQFTMNDTTTDYQIQKIEIKPD